MTEKLLSKMAGFYFLNMDHESSNIHMQLIWQIQILLILDKYLIKRLYHEKYNSYAK